MHIKELMQLDVKFPKKNRWDLERQPEFKKAIQRVIDTGVAETIDGEALLIQILPEYPLVESAMKEPKHSSLLKVRIRVFSQRYLLGVHP